MALLALNEIGLYITKTGYIVPGNYDLPLNTTGITQPYQQYINFLSSTEGGDLLFTADDGKNYYLNMIAGKEYQIAFRNLSICKIVSTGEDWQGNNHSTTMTDLQYFGN